MASDIVERLLSQIDEARLSIWKSYRHLAARDVALLNEAYDGLTKLRAELAEAQGLVIEANNSLFGSQAYFHSIDGGPYHKHHLARAIEDLKWNARATERELAACRAEREGARLMRGTLEIIARYSSDSDARLRAGRVLANCAALSQPSEPDGTGIGDGS